MRDIDIADVEDDFPGVLVEGAMLLAVDARFVKIKCMMLFFFHLTFM